MTDQTKEVNTGGNADDSISSVSADLRNDGSLSEISTDAANDDGCFCIICADHPRFDSDEAYFEHYRNFHDKENAATVDDNNENQESKIGGIWSFTFQFIFYKLLNFIQYQYILSVLKISLKHNNGFYLFGIGRC